MLKKSLIQSLHLFSGILPLRLLKLLSQQNSLIPFYHTISDLPLNHVKHLYPIRETKLFRADLDYLLQHYRPISFQELSYHIQTNNCLPPNSFHLTFDDGLSECYHIIAPILKEKKIPATFFLNSAFVDNKALMFRYKASLLIDFFLTNNTSPSKIAPFFKKRGLKFEEIKKGLLSVRWDNEPLLDELAKHFGFDFNLFLENQKPYLSTPQIHEMIEAGFSFGSHSIDHPTYNKIPLENQLRQTIISQEFVNNQFNIDYKTFAFPFTDVGVSLDFFDKILKEEKFQLTFGGAGIKKETISGQLQRLGFETESHKSARQIIHTEYCYYLIKSFFGKNTIHRA